MGPQDEVVKLREWVEAEDEAEEEEEEQAGEVPLP